jgi:hypothetical protein
MLQTALLIGFSAACVSVWIAGAILLARASLEARRLAQRAKSVIPADLLARVRAAKSDAMRAKASFTQLALVAVRAQIALAAIRRSLAAAQVVFRGLPRPSRNGRTG